MELAGLPHHSTDLEWQSYMKKNVLLQEKNLLPLRSKFLPVKAPLLALGTKLYSQQKIDYLTNYIPFQVLNLSQIFQNWS